MSMSTPDSTENVHDESTAAPQATDAHRPRASTRIPFNAVVEVGAELGPPFEAQAVDVSGTGMHLKTAYLPEVGQTLSCRFEAGRETVVATGEVVWQREASRGGEFGMRFIDLDPDSAVALERMTDQARLSVPGAKVRLHIEGLGAPMRARVRGTKRSELTVGSELGFLQVGKHIDLEDAESGNRRPASIDRVEVELDPGTRVPQLVVALKYEDLPDEVVAAAPMQQETQFDDEGRRADSHAGTWARPGEAHASDDIDVPVPDPTMETDDAAITAKRPSHGPAESDEFSAGTSSIADHEALQMKGPVARAASKVTPALERFAKRTKTTALLLIERAKAHRAGESSPIRRTTAPAPGGSLHATGRKVIRGEAPSSPEIGASSKLAPLFADKKKTMMIGAAGVMVIAIGAATMTKKSTPPASPTETTAGIAPDSANAAAPQPGAPAMPLQALPQNVAPMTPAPVDPIALGASSGMGSIASGGGEPIMTDSVSASGAEPRQAKKVATRVLPFTYGNVSRGNLLRLKMDGSIEKIQGAQQPTGFTVHIPGRRSLEPAAPLAARDARIGSIKVVNDPGGAELALTFKDGVPNYTVRAKGDWLEIVLATPNAAGAAASDSHANAKSHDAKKTVAKRGKKHSKH